MFSGSRNAIIYDRGWLSQDDDVGEQNRRWCQLQLYCPECVDPIALLEIPLVRREDDSNCILCLVVPLDRDDEAYR